MRTSEYRVGVGPPAQVASGEPASIDMATLFARSNEGRDKESDVHGGTNAAEHRTCASG